MKVVRVKWPKGKTIDAVRRDVALHRETILKGTLLAVDPGSKFAGYAVYKAGVLVESGVIRMGIKENIQQRLQKLYEELHVLVAAPDIFATEKIRGSMSHEFLKWAVGVSVAAVRAPVLIEVPIAVWQAIKDEGYEKTDERDAQLIGKSLIWLAKELEPTQ